MLATPKCPGSTRVNRCLSVLSPWPSWALSLSPHVQTPPHARQRHCVFTAAGHEHDGQAPKRLRPKPREPQPVLRIAVPQLAVAAAAAGPDRAVHCQSCSVQAAGHESQVCDHDDGRAAKHLCAAHARWQPLVLVAVESEPYSSLPQA